MTRRQWWRAGCAAAGFLAGLAGMVLEWRWLVGAAVILLGGAVLLRLADARGGPTETPS